MERKTPVEVVDAEFAVVSEPPKSEPALTPGWAWRLLFMLAVIVVPTLLIQYRNGAWPFG